MDVALSMQVCPTIVVHNLSEKCFLISIANIRVLDMMLQLRPNPCAWTDDALYPCALLKKTAPKGR